MCTHITPQCRIYKVRGNSYPGAVSLSSLMLLSTYIDQMQMVTCGDNHSESLVNRTLGQKSRAVHVTMSVTVLCSVQTRVLLCHCLRWREKCDSLAECLRQQHKQWTKFPRYKAIRMKFSALCHLLAMPLMAQTRRDTLYCNDSHLDAMTVPVPSCSPDPRSSTWGAKWRCKVSSMWKGQMSCALCAVGF